MTTLLALLRRRVLGVLFGTARGGRTRVIPTSLTRAETVVRTRVRASARTQEMAA